MSKISVIVPCYNQGKYLDETLNSVARQNYKNWECIIVNDGSTDETERIAKKWCENDKRFKYIFQKNKGLATARNFGIQNSDAEYILPLDSDDLIHEEFLGLTRLVLDNDKSINIVNTNVQLFGASTEVWDNDVFDLKEFLFRNLIICTSLFRKRDWEKSGGYNPNMKQGFEDWDFWMSIIERGGKVYKINKVLFYYRQRDDSMVKKITPELAARLKKQIAMNHLKFYADHLGDPLTLSLKIKDLERQKMLLNNSIAFKVGNIILFPLKLLHKLIKK